MIRTTNWNNFNKVTSSKGKELTSAQRKYAIVQRILRRYNFWDKKSAVVISSGRRWGKTTMHKIITEGYTLSCLATAIRKDDKAAIKRIIDLRINTREQRICLSLTRTL